MKGHAWKWMLKWMDYTNDKPGFWTAILPLIQRALFINQGHRRRPGPGQLGNGMWDGTPPNVGISMVKLGMLAKETFFFPPEMRISGGHLGDSTRCSQCLVSSLVWTRRAIQQPEAPPAGTVYFIQCWDFPNIQCIFFRPQNLKSSPTKKRVNFVPHKNWMNYTRKWGKYDFVDLCIYTLQSSEYKSNRIWHDVIYSNYI